MSEINHKNTIKIVEKDKTQCEKCKINKSCVYNRNKFLCFSCLSEMLMHKFKANLRTCCKILHEDYILVCVSGGNFSMGMLKMFNEAFNNSQSNRKLFFKLKVLYIDDSILLKDEEKIKAKKEERKNIFKLLCENYKFDYDIIYLEEIFKINNDLYNKYFKENKEYFFYLFESIPKYSGYKK